MRKLFYRSLLLLVPVLVYSGFMEFKLGDVPNTYNLKRSNLEKRLDSIQVLVLGSSQATEGINPDFFHAKSFNLANMSQSLFYDTRLVLKYVDRLPKLKYVIATVSYFSLGYEVIDNAEAWKDYYYSQFWGIDFPELPAFDIKKYSKIALYGPNESLGYLKNGFKSDIVNFLQDNGFLKVDSVGSHIRINDSTGKERVKYHETNFKQKRVAANIKNLEELITRLKERNITLVFVTPPVYSTYSKFINQEKLSLTTNYINKLCDKYGLSYFNYLNDKRFIFSDFNDNDHLDYIGAEKFTKILSAEVLEE